MRKVDMGIGAFFVLFGAFGISQSLALPLFQRGGVPGAGMFPLVLSIALVILGGLLIATRLTASRDQYPPFTAVTRGESARVGTAMLAVGVSVALLPIVGYFLSSMGLVAFLLFAIERLRNWRALVTTIALPTVFWVVFVVLLKVRLPSGFLDL